MIITTLHTLMYVIITTLLGLSYGYIAADSTSPVLSCLLTFFYPFLLILAGNSYFTGKSLNQRKYLTAIIFITTVWAWYTSWSVWIYLRSDNVLDVIDSPNELFNNLILMAQDKHHILVRLWYSKLNLGSWQYYYLWLLEFFMCVLLPFFTAWMTIPVRRKAITETPDL